MPKQIERREGRRLFGVNPRGYDTSRPEYPGWIYRRLAEDGAFGASRATLEIGAGSGLATRRLLEHGADPLTIVEPDSRFVVMLEALCQHSEADCRIVVQSFEEARLASRQYDLVAAATSFHWIDQTAGLEKVARLLRTGGRVALWWNVFQDLDKCDRFHMATRSLLRDLAMSPSGSPDEVPFALDRQARESDLCAAGFTDVRYFESRWSLSLTSAEVGRLYEGFSSVQRLPDIFRSRLLDGLMGVADAEFGGQVERNMTSCLYLGTL